MRERELTDDEWAAPAPASPGCGRHASPGIRATPASGSARRGAAALGRLSPASSGSPGGASASTAPPTASGTKRNQVERTSNRLKQHRAIATRYDKLQEISHTLLTIAAILRLPV
jgi:hypothetical protein